MHIKTQEPASVHVEPKAFSDAQSKKYAYGILFLALLLRLVLLNWPAFYTGIEAMTVHSSFAYIERGHFSPENDHALPLRKILQYPTLMFFGDTAIARRLPNAVFGALTAFFLVLLGQALFPGRRIGVLAGLLLATDPFHISFSRTTWEDIPAALFIVLGLFLFSRALEEQRQKVYIRHLLFLGIILALAVATRLYAGAILAGVLVWLVIREMHALERHNTSAWRRRLLFLGASFVVLPIALYMMTYYPWFARGNSLVDWVGFQKHVVYESITDQNMADSEFGKYYGGSYRAIDWFTKPVVFGSQMRVGADLVATQMTLNNPFSWLFIWPVFFWLLGKYYTSRSANLGLVLAMFGLIYFPFIMAQRIILIYSALAVLPVACLFLAIMVDAGWFGAKKTWRLLAAVFLGVILVTNLVLYPLATAVPMPKQISALIPFHQQR